MLDLTALTTEVGNNTTASGNLIAALQTALTTNNQPAVDALTATLKNNNAAMVAAIPVPPVG